MKLRFVLTLIPLCICFVAADVSAHELSPSEKAAIALSDSYEGLPGDGPIRGQHDWFQNVWNQRRGSWHHRTEQDQGAVVFLGDSITHGWQDLPNLFPELKIANRKSWNQWGYDAWHAHTFG